MAAKVKGSWAANWVRVSGVLYFRRLERTFADVV
jgi:hypothetical protein